MNPSTVLRVVMLGTVAFAAHGALATASFNYTNVTFRSGSIVANATPLSINTPKHMVGSYSYSGEIYGFLMASGADCDAKLNNCKTINYPNEFCSTVASSIDDRGRIVGTHGCSGVFTEGFLLLGGPAGKYYPIDYPNAVSTSVSGINDAGQIVGSYQDSQNFVHGFVMTGNITGNCSASNCISFDYPPGPPDVLTTSANGISNAGEIVGYFQTFAGEHGFILTGLGGSFSQVDFSGPNQGTQLSGINIIGQIVGNYLDPQNSGIVHGFVLTAGINCDAGGGNCPTLNFPQSSRTAGFGIGAAGDVVGSYNGGLGYLASSSNPPDYGTSGGNATSGFCCGAGTLGAMVLRANKAYVLSNDHVFGLPTSKTKNSANPGDPMTFPGLFDNACRPASVVANFTFAPTLSTGVDAAIGRVRSGRLSNTGEIQNIGVPASTIKTAIVGMHVAKQGRTTGLTCGTVIGVRMKIPNLPYPVCKQKAFNVTFKNQIAIQAATGSFSMPGDSGSIIVDSTTAEATGLLFASTSDSDTTFANPIADVLKEVGGASMSGGSQHAVSGCKGAVLENNPETPKEILLPESEGRLASEAVDANLDHILQDPSIIAIGVGADQSNPRRGAVLIFVRKGTPHRPIPSELNGVPTRVQYAEPVVAAIDRNCPSNVEGSAQGRDSDKEF
jgi:hypothetical protein